MSQEKSLQEAVNAGCHLFDYHGTLVDNFHHQQSIMIRFLHEIGITTYTPSDIFTEEIMRKASNGADFIRKIFDALKIPLSEGELLKYLPFLRAISQDTAPPLIAGATDYVEKLRTKDKTVGIVTNCTTGWIHRWMEEVDLTRLIPPEKVFALPENNHARLRKPSPVLYQRALAALSRENGRDTTGYEDTTRGVISAVRANLEHIVAVLQSAFLTGPELMSVGATAACQDYTNLIPLIN